MPSPIDFRYALLITLVAIVPRLAAADTDRWGFLPLEEILGDSEAMEVIQNRKYELAHEISVMIGTLPVDPYYKGVSLNVSYTWHFSEVLAWEVGQFTYLCPSADFFCLNSDTKLKDEVFRIALSSGSIEPAFPSINWMVSSHLLFKPLYGKLALFNTRVVHLEAYLQIGPDFLSVAGVAGQQGIPRERLLVGFDFGGGLRMFLTKVISARLDINEVIFFSPTGVLQALHIRLGVGFNFNFEEW